VNLGDSFDIVQLEAPSTSTQQVDDSGNSNKLPSGVKRVVQSLQIGDYVLVKVQSTNKKDFDLFVAQVMDINIELDIEVIFLKSNNKTINCFCASINDKSIICSNDIVGCLDSPTCQRRGNLMFPLIDTTEWGKFKASLM
jgi:hypothetical protein